MPSQNMLRDEKELREMLPEILTHFTIRLTEFLEKRWEECSENVAVLFGWDRTEIFIFAI